MSQKKKDAPFNNPFSNLKLGAEKKPEAAKPAPPPKAPKPQPQKALDEESALFLEAVGEVEQVRSTKSRVGPPAPPSAAELRPAEDAESLARLAELVAEPGDFEVLEDGERVEGAVRGFDPNVMRSLRAGGFPVQARLDLHGLSREQARPALEAFVQKARIAGHRCVQVVTGRGLHSEDGVAVLRGAVAQWLSQGRPGKQVLGFCSAPAKEGGAGALLVLLRR
ncbi:MAG: Smr/MutS family protein [Myxococcaceae bacterium]